MHYLITGGCGFIGSHLVKRLLDEGHAVTVIDDLSNAKRENAAAGAKLVVADIIQAGVLDGLVAEADGVFHLAAVVSVVKSTQMWRQSHQVTLGGTVALLDAIARGKRHIPVVFASSAAVYGDCSAMPLDEEARCLPLSAYGVDKLGCEHHARIGTFLHGIPTIGLRFFNVYGSGQLPDSPYAGVVSIFADRMRRNLPVTIYGDGEQTRDYIYVGDSVEAMVVSMARLQAKTLTHGIFNICTGTQISVNALAQVMAGITATRSSIAYAPARPGEIRVSVGNPGRALQALKFQAATGLQAGLEQMLKIL